MTTPDVAASGGFVAPLERFTKAVNRVFAFCASILVFVIMIFVLVAVFARYGLNRPLSELLDLTTFMLVFVFFLAIAPALQGGSHIEVDLFDPLIPYRWHKFQRLIGKSLTLLFALVLFFFVTRFYIDVVEVDELSFTMITVPLKYVFWIGPVGAAQFLLTAIVDIIRFAQLPPDKVAQYGANPTH